MFPGLGFIYWSQYNIKQRNNKNSQVDKLLAIDLSSTMAPWHSNIFHDAWTNEIPMRLKTNEISLRLKLFFFAIWTKYL